MPGHQQRRQREEAHLNVPSRLAHWLLEQFGFGLKSATEVVTIASLSVADHAQSPTQLEHVASLGGENHAHCHARLMNYLHGFLHLDIIYRFLLPMRTKRMTPGGVPGDTLAPHAMIAPFMVASSLWRKNRDVFCQRFLGAPTVEEGIEKCVEFWRKVPPHDPRMQPVLQAYIRAGVVTDLADFQANHKISYKINHKK